MSSTHSRRWRSSLAAGVFSLCHVASAGASVLWDGDASQGTGVFKGFGGEGNCGTGTITAVSDAQRGTIWRYHKPASSGRCENHGIRAGGEGFVFENGRTYYLGWYSKLTSTANNNANFQWKSYGDGHQQNFPIVLKMISGEMSLMQRQPGGNPTTIIWRRRIAANEWHHYALGLVLSQETRGGSIEFWFDGVQQTFNTGGTKFLCRTYDTGNHNCPKWGVYGGTGTDMNNYTDAMKVGTTYADVAPEGANPTVTPTPTPTGAPTFTPTPTRTPTPTPTTCVGCGSVEITPSADRVTASTNDGNTPGNAVDNNLATRWSANGDGQWIQFDLAAVRTVTRVSLGVYNGNSRRNRFDLQVAGDDLVWQNVLTNVQTSGTTTQEQAFDFPSVPARYVRYLGHMNDVNGFNSLTEVSIFAIAGSTPVPTVTPSTPVELTPGANGLSASGDDGNVAANAVDNSLATRWSANGDGQWIQLDLGSGRIVSELRIAWFQGDTRASTFDVLVSDVPTTPSDQWTPLLSRRTSSGNSAALETYDVADTNTRYVRIVGHGNNSPTKGTWNSIAEVEVWGN